MNSLTLIVAKFIIVHSLVDILYSKYKKYFNNYSWLFRAISAFLFFYIFSGTWNYLIFSVLIFYFFTGLIKNKIKETTFIYILDYIIHIVFLTIVGVYVFNINLQIIFRYFENIFSNKAFWIISASFVVIMGPAGKLIGMFTEKWREQIENEYPGLLNAGVIIGYLERILILIFILTNKLEAIGFLIAAKSILRFGEINKPKHREEAEYILIGTMSSFTMAIIVGLFVKYLLSL